MRSQDPRVSADVEALLVGQIQEAGELGGSFGAPIGGRSGGGSGASWAAKRLRTVVEDRPGAVLPDRAAALTQVRTEFPNAAELPTTDPVLRVVIPIGRTGMQQVVADIAVGDRPAPGPSIRVYGKEGLLNRKPTARTADALLQALGRP